MRQRSLTALLLAAMLLATPHGRSLAATASVHELLDSAQLWQARGREDLSRAALLKLLSIEGDNAEALYALGMLELRADHPALAQDYLQSLLQHHPEAALTRDLAAQVDLATQHRADMARVRLLARGGRYAEARKLLEQLFPRGPPEGSLGIEYCEVLARAPQGWRKARALLDRWRQRHPQELRYRLAYADLLIEQDASRASGVRMLLALAERPDAQSAGVLEHLRAALNRIDWDPRYLYAFERFQKLYPDDDGAQQQLRKLRRLSARQWARDHDPAALTRAEALQRSESGDFSGAESLLQAQLAPPRANPEAQGTLGLIRLRQARYAEAGALFAAAAARSAANPGKWRSLLGTARFWGALQEARAALASGALAEARARVDLALRLQPQEPAALTLRADIGVAQQHFADAEQDYRAALALDPKFTAARRGLLALLDRQGSSGEYQRVFAESQQYTPGLTEELNRELTARLRAQAKAQRLSGRRSAALALLEKAVAVSPADPWSRFDLARLYVDLQLADLGRDTMLAGSAAAPGEVEMAFAAATFFKGIDDPHTARQLLEQIAPAQRTREVQRLAQELEIDERVRRAAAAYQQGDANTVREELSAATRLAAGDPDLTLIVANAWAEAGQPRRASALLDDQAGLPAAGALDVSLQRARLLARLGEDERLQRTLAALDASPLDGAQRQAVAELRAGLLIRTARAAAGRGATRTALVQIHQATALTPESGSILVQAGWIAQSIAQYRLAVEYFRKAHALETAGSPDDDPGARGLRYMESLRDSYASSGFEYNEQPGVAGQSEFTRAIVPSEVRWSLDYRRALFVRVDDLDLSAGTAATSAHGLMPGIGFETRDWRIDLGQLPSAFPVHYAVGGVRYNASALGGDLLIDLSRRAVTSTLISFAGERDPSTGLVWGGVRSSGLEAQLRHPLGTLAAFAAVDWHRLQGEHVLENSEQRLRAGADWPLHFAAMASASLGAQLQWWHYDHSERYYTLGQGGYYSPQSYLALSIPLTLSGRHGAWTWRLRSSLSYSVTQEHAEAYYPLDPLLQAAAANPLYAGGAGSGGSLSLSGVAEYHSGTHWSFGALIDVDRSQYYAPNTIAAYLRYNLVPMTNEPPLPSAPRPYAYY